MLETLRNIVQEVNAAESLDEALSIIVRRVRDAMKTEVCSVYMRDSNSGRYVFQATEGLNRDQIGVASLAAGEGLVGLVDEGRTLGWEQTFKISGAWPPPAPSLW